MAARCQWQPSSPTVLLINFTNHRLAERPESLPPVVRYLWGQFGVIGYISDDHRGEYPGFAHELMGLKWPFGAESRRVLRSRGHVGAVGAAGLLDVADRSGQAAIDHHPGAQAQPQVDQHEVSRPTARSTLISFLLVLASDIVR
jgi:hypothetical protein